MKILISGSTGLIGTRVVEYLRAKGHQVNRLVRPGSSEPGIAWDIAARTIDLEQLEGHDAVIHLAGASIAGGRWTAEYKEKILKSRVEGTYFLAKSLAQLKHKPKVFLSGSAIGYYGNVAFESPVDEDSAGGTGFLAEVVAQWETAAKPAEMAGIAVTYLRTGVVLSKHGGALKQMLPPFYLGLGGPIGSGHQGLSWIALDEIPIIYEFLLHHPIPGPVNITGPAAVTSREFGKVLGQVIHRPAVMPLPGFAVKLLLGEMGQELLLAGQNVSPKKLLEHGYVFRYPDLGSALEVVLK